MEGRHNLLSTVDGRSNTAQLNVAMATAITVTGAAYKAIKDVCSMAGVPILSQQTYNALRDHCIAPAVSNEHADEQNMIIADLRASGDGVVLSVDAQFDSPGYTASICSIGFMISSPGWS
jgi:hypothetical protein